MRLKCGHREFSLIYLPLLVWYYWYGADMHRVVHPLWVQTKMITVLTESGGEFNQPILTPETVSAAV